MIVIVEGIDRVGKTTLCEKLRERGFIILKDGIDILKDRGFTKREVAIASAAKVDSTFIFAKQLSDSGVNVVLDRCHLTEIVYGWINRGVYEPDVIRDAEKRFAHDTEDDALLVLVEATNIDEACERAGEDLVHHAQMFDVVFSMSPITKFRTNFNNLDEAVNRILKYQKETANDQ